MAAALVLPALLIAPHMAMAAVNPQVAADFSSLSIEDLANIEITSVSKSAEPLSQAAAAIYVITQDDIRRSGAVSIPEMLRFAPNLQVGGVNASSYVISSRGFNNELANKLLVLIDGRSVYTPLYSGVFWNAQDVVPENIDRIEVISGPGGTLWGANAVNGVINVVTKDSREMQGLLARAGGGTFERNGVVQYGGAFNADATYRVYAKGFRRGNTVTAAGVDAGDTWKSVQGGFRTDWAGDGDKITLQGDINTGTVPQSATVDRLIDGHNVLARWSRALDDGASFQVQAYYDHEAQVIQAGSENAIDTYDIEAQHGFSLGARHRIVWGGGYRFVRDHFVNRQTAGIFPASRHLDLGNVFAEDKIALTDTLTLAAGLKLEHNVYTGLEYLPSMRLSWQAGDRTLLWSAISRAVRTPSRVDRDLIQPGVLIGGPNFMSEKLIAYEAGYRGQLGDAFSLSVSAFYNVYDDLRTIDAAPGPALPLQLANTMEGETYGVEAWGNYAVTSWWRLSAGFNLLEKDLRLKPGSRDIAGIASTGNDPSHQASLRSSMTLPQGFEADLGLRIVGALPTPRVKAYTALDARLGWNMSEHVMLSVSGTNLLDRKHPEAGTPSSRNFSRAVYASVSWKP